MTDVRMMPASGGSSLAAAAAASIRKAESACRFCEIKDVCVIGSRVTGVAFGVHDQMAPGSQGVLKKAKDRLLAALAPDSFVAFEECIMKRLRDGQMPDAIFMRLQRLALLAGECWTSAFVRSLPEQMQEALGGG
ncbi:hypothetical protein M513_08432 [Trichuris suis]|nr:hypothetical protein M513_08432 [Trichuris suis]